MEGLLSTLPSDESLLPPDIGHESMMGCSRALHRLEMIIMGPMKT
jgi:hypothetical protein